MKILISTLLIPLFILPLAFAAEDKHSSEVTSLYHLANILGIQVPWRTSKTRSFRRLISIVSPILRISLPLPRKSDSNCKSLNLTYEELQKFKTPVIAHLKTTFENENPANEHFIVVEHANKKWVRLFDAPSRSLYQAAVVVSRDRFLDRWTGQVLALSENQRQQKQPVLGVSPILLDLDALITLQHNPRIRT